MGGKAKSLCKLEKDGSKKALALAEKLSREPAFECEKCHRSAASKKNLCEPAALGGRKKPGKGKTGGKGGKAGRKGKS